MVSSFSNFRIILLGSQEYLRFDRHCSIVLCRTMYQAVSERTLQIYGLYILNYTLIVPCIIIIVSKNKQHDDTCGLSFIFRGSRHSFFTCFELLGSSSSGVHFSLYSQPGIVCNLLQ